MMMMIMISKKKQNQMKQSHFHFQFHFYFKFQKFRDFFFVLTKQNKIYLAIELWRRICVCVFFFLLVSIIKMKTNKQTENLKNNFQRQPTNQRR